MTSNDQNPIHASCVSIDGHGVMISGPSGSGKSDLALRLIDRGATLICDDYVNISRVGDDILLAAPQNIQGKIEVRSLGVLDQEYVSPVTLMLKIELKQEPERFPMDRQTEVILGKSIPTVAICAFEQSAPIKVEMALQLVREAVRPS